MDWLVDTNVLLRLLETGHPMQETSLAALGTIKSFGDRSCIILQKLIEFWSVATRPQNVNGLGYTQARVELEIQKLESVFTLLPESPTVASEWRRLVQAHPTFGKNVHDTRLVAPMLDHHVTHLLTFNSADFARFSEIKVFEPGQLLRSIEFNR